MLEWLGENSGSLIVGGIVAAVVVLLIIKMVRDHRRGKGGCSCGCESCGADCYNKCKKREA